MARGYYHVDEERMLGDIHTLRRMLADVVIHPAPCPLALAQLDELRIFAQKLNSTAGRLHASIREAGHARPGE